MSEAAIRSHFKDQAQTCAVMGSAFTAQLCELGAERLRPDTAVTAALLGWQNDPGADALALRWCGALHGLVLDGLSPDLATLYPPNHASPETLWQAVCTAHKAHEARLLQWLRSPPQTNEVARSTILLAGALRIAEATRLPLDWREIGASAGLNLQFDRLAYDGGDWTWGECAPPVTLRPDWMGPPPPVSAALSIASRAGCDRAPLDAEDPSNHTRLLAYIWPDMPERLERTRAAIALATASPSRLDKRDAADWLIQELATQRPGHCFVLAYTVMWQYLPEATKARIQQVLTEASARATAEMPLARLAFEWDRPGIGRIDLTLWPGGETRSLGEAQMHAAWIKWFGAEGR